MPLGARVNHVNTNGTTGQPMIVYKSDGKNRIIDISAAGALELPSSGSAPRNIVVALFKTSAAGTTTLIRESVCVIRFNSSVPKTSFSLNAITRVYGGDRFEIRMAQFGSSYAAIDVKFRDLNFSAVAP